MTKVSAVRSCGRRAALYKVAKQIYTDPDDIAAYEYRKRSRRNLLRLVGGLMGGWTGGVAGAGISSVVRGGAPSAIATGASALTGAGLGAVLGDLIHNYNVRYNESAGFDATLPTIRAQIGK